MRRTIIYAVFLIAVLAVPLSSCVAYEKIINFDSGLPANVGTMGDCIYVATTLPSGTGNALRCTTRGPAINRGMYAGLYISPILPLTNDVYVRYYIRFMPGWVFGMGSSQFKGIIFNPQPHRNFMTYEHIPTGSSIGTLMLEDSSCAQFGGVNGRCVSNGSVVADGTWHLVEARTLRNGANGKIQIWLDGASIMDYTLDLGSTAMNGIEFGYDNASQDVNGPNIGHTVEYEDIVIADYYVGPNGQGGGGGTPPPPSATSCTLPWGGTITSGASVAAYSSNSVACGSSCSAVSQTRTCSNGTLSGSANYSYQNCAVATCPPIDPPPPPSPGIFFSEGWENNSKNQSFNSSSYGNLGTNSSFIVQNNNVASGNYALEHRFAAGGTAPLGGTQHIADARSGPVWSANAGNHLMDLYTQYKVKYSPGFDWGTETKQFIIGTEDSRRHDTSCCNPWASHYLSISVFNQGRMLAEASNKQAASGQWLSFPANVSGYNSSNPLTIQSDRWYTVEVRRRLNDMGSDNGIFQMWVGGQLVADYSNVRWRVPWDGSFGADAAYGTNFVMISDYLTSAASRAQSIYYDDIKVSTSSIGGSSTPPDQSCGDNSCDNSETCSTCPGDCGTCPVTPPPAETYNLTDFTHLVADWLRTLAGSPADVNTDNRVNSRDLGIMMSNWSL